MRTLKTCSVAVAIVLAAASAAAQVTKTIPGKTESVTASVEAVDLANRTVTVKKPDGKYEVFYVPTSIKRFETLKVGDKINAKYYENVVLTLKAPGAPDVNKSAGGVVRADGGKPAGTASRQTTITATITAIDPKVPSITFSAPTTGRTAVAWRTSKRWRR